MPKDNWFKDLPFDQLRPYLGAPCTLRSIGLSWTRPRKKKEGAPECTASLGWTSNPVVFFRILCQKTRVDSIFVIWKFRSVTIQIENIIDL